MKDKRLAPISVRVTAEQRALLGQFSEAAGMSLSGYMKWCSLERDKHSTVKLPVTRRRNPTKDQKALAKLFGMLGASRIANNLNQIAKAIHTGTLVVSAETEHLIKQACKAILEMRDLLVQSLGLKA